MVDRYDDDILLGYIEGDLSPDQQEQFEKLLAQDEQLRGLVARLQEDRLMLRDLPREVVPAGLMDPVNDQLERHMLLDTAVSQANGNGVASRWPVGRLFAYSGLAAMMLVSAALIVHTLTDEQLLYPVVSADDEAGSSIASKRSASPANRQPAPPPAIALADKVSRDALAKHLGVDRDISLTEPIDSLAQAKPPADHGDRKVASEVVLPRVVATPMANKGKAGGISGERSGERSGGTTGESTSGASSPASAEMDTVSEQSRFWEDIEGPIALEESDAVEPLALADGSKQRALEIEPFETFAILVPVPDQSAKQANVIETPPENKAVSGEYRQRANSPMQVTGRIGQLADQPAEVLNGSIAGAGEKKADLDHRVDSVPEPVVTAGAVKPLAMTLDLKSDHPSRVLQAVLDWAIDNRVQTVSLLQNQNEDTQRVGEVTQESQGQEPERWDQPQRVELVLAPHQLAGLMSHLNELKNQPSSLLAHPLRLTDSSAAGREQHAGTEETGDKTVSGATDTIAGGQEDGGMAGMFIAPSKKEAQKLPPVRVLERKLLHMLPPPQVPLLPIEPLDQRPAKVTLIVQIQRPGKESKDEGKTSGSKD